MKGVLLFVVLCATSVGYVAAGCGIDGFDFRKIHYGQYWEFSVPDPTENCLHINNTAEISSCIVYFAVCKPLPTALCEANNVSYCQVVTGKNGTEYKFVIGNYSSEHNYVAIGENGFGAIRYGYQYPNEDKCSATFTTTFNFECDPYAKFETSQPNITEYLILAERIPDAECNIAYHIFYSGACYQQPTLAPDHCSLNGYDTTAISKKDYFKASVASDICYNFDGEDCMILMSFCHPLPLDISENCANPESAVCQANEIENADKSWSMGAYENYTRFYENVDENQGGFHAEYAHGSNPGDPDCPGGIQSRIIFVCDKNANWNYDKDVTSYLEIERDPCYYNIIAKYNGACYKSKDINSSSNVYKTSYIGWIIIAVFLFAILTYLVIGTTFKFFVQKDRGFNVLPHIDFWRNFVLLSLEGCKFSLDIITCHRFDGVPKNSVVNYDHL